jgi:type IV secretory pathway TraG/TraD family ATPase VirD4
MTHDRRFFWGGHHYYLKDASRHCLIMGATGSGKTLSLRLLMQSVLPYIGMSGAPGLPPLDHRAIIYDAKQDMLSYLYGMGPDPKQNPAGAAAWRRRIKVLNPFDARCCAWDIAADIKTPGAAQQLATNLIPPEPESSQPFFSDAARHLLYGAILSLALTRPGAWTFRDVVLAMRDMDLLRTLLLRTKHTSHLVGLYMNPGRTFDSVKANIATKMMPYEVVAALWSKAKEKVSLRDFLDPSKERLILVLGNDEENRAAIDAINRVLIKRLSELIVGQPENEERRTWIILDEVREMGRLDGLPSLLLRGRSKGACVVLGFQDIDGMKDVYGEYLAQELVGQCAFKAILRLESPTTAEWAAKHFGVKEERVLLDNQSINLGGQAGITRGKGENIHKTEHVLYTELLKLPAPQDGKIHGFYLTPVAHYRNEVDIQLTPRVRGVEFVPRPESEQFLEPWDETERKALGLEAELLAGEGQAFRQMPRLEFRRSSGPGSPLVPVEPDDEE